MKFPLSTGLAVALVAVTSATSGFAYENPADRYQDAYKKYTNAACPLVADEMEHFVYFSRDRDGLRDHPLLTTDRFDGAQIMYSWRDLEPVAGQYDFSSIREDVNYLAKHGKRLFVQLQDASFDPAYKPVPDYLLTTEFDGGAAPKYAENGEIEGWVAKRWNESVQRRFAALLIAFGAEFDGIIEGVNLQETSIGEVTDPTFTPERYVEALKVNMQAMKSAFPTSTTMLYANFMAGEWLPWEDHGYLRGIYEFGEKFGIGLGAPDLMYQRKGQLNHALAMMHESTFTTPLGIAVQDGNYVGETGTLVVVEDRPNIVPVLHAFAQDFLQVDYMFWVNQEPYFVQDVLPCFSPLK